MHIKNSSRPGANLPLCFDDMLKSCCHLFIVKRSKPKSCAARLQSWDYLGQVVTNQTEPCVLCKFLHYCSAKHIKNILSIASYTIPTRNLVDFLSWIFT